MTNLEKWQRKLAEAKDAEDFIYQFNRMSSEFFEKQCFPTPEADYCVGIDNCKECKVRWLNMEARDE